MALPGAVPDPLGRDYWGETLSRADIRQALPTSLITTLLVTLLSAVICFPASYAFARLRFADDNFCCFHT
jgi:putative spermidine/putrescine transport system permease protein